MDPDRTAESVTVHPGTALEPSDPTAGMQRFKAFQTDRTWTGVVQTEAGAVSGWHHHGDHESTLYVVEGQMRLQSGPGGEEVVDAGPGDFLRVPPHVVHRESNPGDGVARAVIVRNGEGPPTVNVEGPAPR